MKRMRLTVDASGHVDIGYEDSFTGEWLERRFSAGWSRETWVIEHMAHGRSGQVCEELASTGSTLRASESSLPRVIRREYRAMRRSEQKWYRARA